MRPSASETESVRRVRLQREADEKSVSDRIDEELRQERERLKRRKLDVKLLLLGQAESGKSTLQKQFQLLYSPQTLEKERASWRTVVYFNVVRSLKHILDTLQSWNDLAEEYQSSGGSSDQGYSSSGSNAIAGPSTSRHRYPPVASSSAHRATESISKNGYDSSTTSSSSVGKSDNPSYQIANLRRRLSPLVAMDTQLADLLSGGVTVAGSGRGGVFVRSGWQARAIENSSSLTKMGRWGKRATGKDPEAQSPINAADEMMHNVQRMLELSNDDIETLWAHPIVKKMIADRKLKLDEWSEFFLNGISAVSRSDYVPTVDDILRARIQTMGVVEHTFNVDLSGQNILWRLYDVGGARGQRHTWIPYFDDVHAIIFVAPISAFDQYLEEDARTNRIDDSLQLFTTICSNPLLKNVHLVLFLNKTDILQSKLASGLRIGKYITSFGNRANNYDTAVQYFRAHFLQVHRKNNQNKRVLYSHLTSVVDTKTTQSIIGNVRDAIFRGYLKSAALV